jgi:hypothetical protein
MVIGGRKLSWRKSVKYEAMIGLPARLPGVDLELAMSGMKEAGPRFADAGWIVRDALAVSADPEVYRDYILCSRAHFSLAKDQNVILKSGWFSDRSAAYLAAGKPVIDEDTGFGAVLPTGRGPFRLRGGGCGHGRHPRRGADPVGHGRAAREIAQRHFDAARSSRAASGYGPGLSPFDPSSVPPCRPPRVGRPLSPDTSFPVRPFRCRHRLFPY